MRHRPKRENYDRGLYGDIDYQERLERYCTYLENRNKVLTEQCDIPDVVRQSEQYFCCKEQINQRCNEQCLGCFQFENKD